ncbi:hypothetical protein SNE40_015276 [Patella caerulea]|uniref:CUB domain-containing protein n=1 Tax=Patella caerulea TaxID=87958 RepID=A0AAN8PIX5_PATCE
MAQSPMADNGWFYPGLKIICFLTSFIFTVIDAESVYMDKWGHCTGNAISVDGDVYTLFSTGGGFNHESLICEITFKARHDKSLCLTFKTFSIDDCGVTLKIFERSTASGKNRDMFGCNDRKPNRICTTERYFTVKLEKAALNNNQNYEFQIDVQESDSFTGEDVVITSIGVFVGIIVTVMIIILVIAVLVIYCCCKKMRHSAGANIVYNPANTAPPPQYPVQPSAPPLHDHPDSHQPNNVNVPPYTPPPPYSQYDPSTEKQPV